MERLKRNPAGWGLVLGGAVIAASALFAWFVVEGQGGEAPRDPGRSRQTIAFLEEYFAGADLRRAQR